jgi:hypothetical protein
MVNKRAINTTLAYKNIQLILIKTASTIYEKLIRKAMPLSPEGEFDTFKTDTPL